MKTIINLSIILITLTNFTICQNNIRIVQMDDIECYYGDTVKITSKFINVRSGTLPSITAKLRSDDGDVPLKYEYKLVNDPLGDRQTLLVSCGFLCDTHFNNSDYNVEIAVFNLTDPYDGHSNHSEIRVIKPKYPILTPLLDSIYYAEQKAKFSFAALGLDNDTLYSYEINDAQTGQVIKKEVGKPMVILDDLLNNENYFNHDINIVARYSGSTFNYKTSSSAERVDTSIWRSTLKGPGQDQLKFKEPYIIEEDGQKYFCYDFYYKVGEKVYEPQFQNVKVRVRDRLIDYKIKSNSIRFSESSYQFDISNTISIDFTDQYNSSFVGRVVTLPLDWEKQ
jgi:hypothetical protein